MLPRMNFSDFLNSCCSFDEYGVTVAETEQKLKEAQTTLETLFPKVEIKAMNNTNGRSDGRYGYIIVAKDAQGREMMRLDLQVPVFTIDREIMFDSLQRFRSTYKDCVQRGYYMEKHHDYDNQKIGFNCYTINGVIWYSIPISLVAELIHTTQIGENGEPFTYKRIKTTCANNRKPKSKRLTSSFTVTYPKASLGAS